MHSFYSDVTFEQVYLHLILSSYLDDIDLKNLNIYYILFVYLCKMTKKIQLDYIYNLFDYNLNYKNQETIPKKCQLQYLFLALIHRLDIPNMIRLLGGNQTAAYRDSEAILAKCKLVLPPKLLDRLQNILCNMNPIKFYKYTLVEDRAEYCKYGNYSLVDRNLP